MKAQCLAVAPAKCSIRPVYTDARRQGGGFTLVSIFVAHVILGGGEADVQGARAHSSPLKGMHCQAGSPKIVEGQDHKAPLLASCVQRPYLTVCLHSVAGHAYSTAGPNASICKHERGGGAGGDLALLLKMLLGSRRAVHCNAHG